MGKATQTPESVEEERRGLLAVGRVAGAEPLFPSLPAWSLVFMVSPAQARPETFPNSLESHNGEGFWEALGRGAGSEVDEGGTSGEG